MQKFSGLAIDDKGNALAGATVAVKFNSDGVTDADLFEDDETTAKANPVLTDARAFYEFKTRDGVYDIIITKGGSQRRINGIVIVDTSKGPALLGKLLGADFDSTADQEIRIDADPGRYLIDQILVTNPSISLTTAVGGIYTGAGKTGTILVPATRKYEALTASGKLVDLYDIVAEAGDDAGTSLPNSTDTIVNFDVVTIDQNGAITTGASWRFTAPRSGRYSVIASVLMNSAAWVVNERARLLLFKNDSFVKTLEHVAAHANGTFFMTAGGDLEIDLDAGDFIDVRFNQNTGLAQSTDGNPDNTHVQIRRLGPRSDADDTLSADPLYLSLTTPQGVAATADLYVVGRRVA